MKGGKHVATCETELIERAARGDQQAFRQLWEAHHALAMAAALRLCHQHALAEEICQGAFLLAWRGLPRFQKGYAFRPWLMRILYRHALNVMEQQRLYLKPLSLDDLDTQVLFEEDAQGRQMDLQERVAQREEVRVALARLNAEQRKVIALRYGADLTEVEIAHVLDWPVGTVKSRLNRARDRLRILLNDEGR
jgi:RNA polymerase sigma-70 factor (ECF subfamily)